MKELSDSKKLRPWMGFALFAFVMIFFVFVCAPIQIKLKIWGVIITEVSLAAIAVIYGLIFKVPLKEMFPVKKISVKDFFGSIFLLMGSFSLATVFTALTATLFPSSTTELDNLSTFLYQSMGYIPTILVIAVMPAICEEAIHRGAILSNFRSMKRDWLIVLIMALFFGINHMSVLRFPATAILGATLSYVVVKKNNILLSMMLHFFNNFISASVGYFSTKLTGGIATSTVDFSSLVGTYMIFAFAAPLFLVLGSMLLVPEEHKKMRFLVAGIISAVMLITGAILTVTTTMNNMIVNSSVSYEVTEDASAASISEFDIDKERTATVVAMVNNAEGDYNIRIDGDKGSNIINAPVPTGGFRMITYNVELQPDHYYVTLIPGDNSVGEKPVIQIVIR